MQPLQSARAPSAETLLQLKKLIIEVNKARLKPEEISNEANLYDDCGLDSLSITEFVVEVEHLFNTSFSEQELDTGVFHNLSLFAQLIEDKLIKDKKRPNSPASRQ